MIYFITGNTYPIKDDLKSFGCKWNGEDQNWITPDLEKDSHAYLRIKSLCKAFGAHLVPEKLTPECQKIQDILKKK